MAPSASLRTERTLRASDWRQDLSRHEDRLAIINQPSLWAIGVYRFGRQLLAMPRGMRVVLHPLYFAAYSIVRLATGIDIPRGASIGGGLLIHHFGGVVIHPRAVIGSNCTIRHGVTVGARDVTGPPTIGEGVTLGAYAQVLGNIRVGDNATVGALSLVITDVVAGATMVGIPAKPLSRNPREL